MKILEDEDHIFNELTNPCAKDIFSEIENALFIEQYMGQYVGAIGYSLYEWDKEYGTGGSLGWSYYKSMAWGGLFQTDPNTGLITSETDAFKELEPNANNRQDIADIVVNELKNNSDAKGTKCN